MSAEVVIRRMVDTAQPFRPEPHDLPRDESSRPAVAPYRLLAATEVAAWPAQQWVIKGVLPAAGTACVFGPSGSGKSFLVADMAFTIADDAHGRRWFGHRVRHAPVVIVALEGAGGMAGRCRAWKIHRRRELPARLRFVVEPFSMADMQDPARLAAAVRAQLEPGWPAPVVIIDTLARAATGLDENSQQDMGRVVDAAGFLADELGGLVVLVHHTGHATAERMRGSSALHAAMDAEVRVVRDDAAGSEVRRWSIAKMKDGRDDLGDAFTLRVVELGHDEDGDPVTSCVVERIEVALEDSSAATLLELEDTKQLLRLIEQFNGLRRWVSVSPTSPYNAARRLGDEPTYPRQRSSREVFALLRNAERAGLLQPVSYRGKDRHELQRWALTEGGREVAGLPAGTAGTAGTLEVHAPAAEPAEFPAGTAGTAAAGIEGAALPAPPARSRRRRREHA